MEVKLPTQSHSREHSTWFLEALKEIDRYGEFNLLKSLINIITKKLNKNPHTNGMNISNHSRKYVSFFKHTSFQFLSNGCFLIEFKRMLCDKLRICCLLQWAVLCFSYAVLCQHIAQLKETRDIIKYLTKFNYVINLLKGVK